MDEELSDLLFEQALAADRELHEKLGSRRRRTSTPTSWRREAKAHEDIYVDLVSND